MQSTNDALACIAISKGCSSSRRMRMMMIRVGHSANATELAVVQHHNQNRVFTQEKEKMKMAEQILG